MTALPILEGALPQVTAPQQRRASMPARHLADLDPAGRRAAVAELGEREFRAGQLSAHYFGRLVRDPAAMTDLPPAGLGLCQRHVTVSTVGLVPAMRRLTAEGLAVTLAVSLHAPDDELRDELVPVNQRWPVAEVLDVAWDYAGQTGRRVSIEYAMIRDVNDQPWRADLLGRLLSGRLAHVNLIPLNPTPGSRWDASPKPVEREFVRRLRMAGVPTTVRDTRGREIDGACGQLAAAEVAQ